MSVTTTRPAPDRAVVRRSPAATAAVLGVLAALLASAGSWVPSLWGDEVTSIMSAQRPLPSLLRMLGHVDAVHGASYLGLHLWGGLFGFSPFSVRLPSAVAVGLTTAAVVLVATRLRSARVGAIAGAVCAVLPRVTYMGEEARSFAFSAAIVSWLTLLLLVAIGRERVRPRWWVAYGLLLAVGVYVFLYTALFVLVHAAVLALSRSSRRMAAGWLIAVGCAALVTAPLMVFALREHGQIAYLGTTRQTAPQTLFAGLWFGQWPFAVVAWALILVAVVAEARQRSLVTRATRGESLFGPGPRLPSLVFLALGWLLVPTGLLLAGHVFFPDFTARYVSFCAPAAALLIACGLDELLRLRVWAGVVAGALVIALSLPVYLAQRTPFAKNDSDWAQIAAVVGRHARPGDAVVFDESTRPSRLPRLAMHAYPADFRNTRDVTLAVPFTASTTWRDTALPVEEAADRGRFERVSRVWVIEYAAAGHAADHYGVADLAALGFRPTTARFTTHRGLVALYERTP